MPSVQGAAIAAIALKYNDCSARGPTPEDVDRYAEFIIRPTDPVTTAARAYYLANPSLSTCALTVLRCWGLAGVPDQEVVAAYYPNRIGKAFNDMETVGMRCGAWEAGPPRGLLLAGDVWIITDAVGSDAHTGLCVEDQSAPDKLETVEGGQFDGKGSTAIGRFTRTLVKRPDGSVWMGQRKIFGVIRGANMPVLSVGQIDTTAYPAAFTG